MTFTLSKQQQAVLDFVVVGKGNGLVRARAGCGKTATLIEAIGGMSGRVACCAYNNKIAKELEEKAAKRSLRAHVGTMHRFGFRAWRKAYPAVKLEGMGKDKAGFYKFKKIFETLETPSAVQGFVRQAVSFAMQNGIGIVCKLNDPEAWLSLVAKYDLEEKLAGDLLNKISADAREQMLKDALRSAHKVMIACIKMADKVITFDEMIYMPLYANVLIDTYDWVLVDEAQDLSTARRLLAKKMMSKNARLIAVGDDRQAIYRFSGADNDSLENIKKDFACKELPLTVTYRCPKAVVAQAQRFVPDFTAHESAPEGLYKTITEEEFDKVEFDKTDAILCRNTKPLVATAFNLIRRGIACHVEGKEIGAGLMALAKRWNSIKTMPALKDKLNDYLNREIEKLTRENKDAQADALSDKVETLIVIIDSLPKTARIDDLEAKINSLFADSEDGHKDSVVLCSLHRAKGLEWNRVFMFGNNKFLPSPYAKKEETLQQEANLHYVGITRAQRELIDVNVY